ncbi:disease resistance protein RGA2-like [Castanea sativa]|uniref:disease resistance protein RGA2-like n=1 Tax=Castanea sativa TaxID=21020 RepID=UPI003F64A9B7
MADAILFGLTQKIIENLASRTFQDIGSLWGVNDDLKTIESTVSRIKAVLQDAAEQQSDNHQVKDWIEKLNDVIYEADDLFSEFYTEATRRSLVSGNKVVKEVRTCFSCSNPLAFRYKMSRKIKAMRQKLNAIAEDKNKFSLKVDNVETNDMSRKRETHSFVQGEDVIGRDEDKQKIINLLFDSNVEENVSVIPIVGIGGLGKTTLAKYVYNDEEVQKYFELKMWACISDVFDLKVIIENIIASTSGNTPVGKFRIDQLQSQLREKIDKKKYLLVLDDIWTEDPENWRELKCLLMGGSKGSKIIITTRLRLVAEITHTVSPYINLKGLSIEQSWVLFEKVAFRKGQEADIPKLETIGREIVNMCLGVPLAIKSVGNVLCFMEKESEWSSVKNNIEANVTQTNGIFPILKLSYDHLPSHLKSCFTYCSLFPKDYEMDKETVIQLWIAQGFVQSSNKNQQLEDVGDKYFKDLLWRSFFEEVENYEGLRYKMHDLIHDLAKSIIGEECKLVSFDGKDINEKNRHVSCPFSIGLSFNKTLSLLVKVVKPRTFLLTFNEFSGALEESMLNTIILRFKSLRALDLHALMITSIPNSIGKLIHLKYLDLSFNWVIETLPDSITTLLNLQVLKLNDCTSLKKLPKKFRELVSLKHLYNHGCDNLSHMPCGLGQMTSLQTLPLFIVSTSSHTGGLGELKDLNNLRGTLEITHLERLEESNSESIVVNLREKQHLEKLILNWNHQDQVDNNEDVKLLEDLHPHQNLKYLEVYQYKGVKFSSWVSSLTNLVDLRIVNCKRCRYLPPLSHLFFLKSLWLDTMNDLEYISDNDMSKEVSASSTALSTQFFPSLKSLRIEACPNLKGWWGRTGRDLVATTSASTPNHPQDQSHNSLPLFPLLSDLWIRYCPKMTSMPLFPNLEESLYLENVSLKPLQETMSMSFLVPSSSSSLSSSSPLSKLNGMTLVSIEDIESLSAEWALYSLKKLGIWKCPRLTSMSGAVRNLTSLCSLSIGYCEEFDPLRDMHDDGMEWRCLICLRELHFSDIPKLKSLPVGLQCISTLKQLTISNCPNLMTLLELTSLEYLGIERCGPNLTSLLEISCLTSLRSLRIGYFPNLITFPESIRNPISLESLTIVFCPSLTTLPNDGCLKSLRELKIQWCPQLSEKYENKIEKDCPNLEIKW